MDPAGELLEILNLERLETDLFRGHSPKTRLQRVFGGQVIGQALSAAYETVKDRTCHSLHAYFLRPGDPNVPIIYQVERTRDGRSFSTRRVVAIQHGRPIFNLGAGFHIDEDGYEHQISAPDVPGPDEMEYAWADLGEAARKAGVMEPIVQAFVDMQPLEFRFPDRIVATKDAPLPHENYAWFRIGRALDISAVKHQCVLAFATDMTLLDSTVRPHGVGWATMSVEMASLDHALWFHAPVRTDDWLLYVKDSPFAGGARGFARGSIYDRSGKLVASVAQEGLIRPFKSPES